jgi:hypothetical protein
MPPDATHVASIKQRRDNTLLVLVQTESFAPGQQVEVSVYLTQGEIYAAHYEKKYIPFSESNDPKQQPAVLHVELPATELDTTQPVTVITRVAEIWPTVLQQDTQAMAAFGRAVDGHPDQGPKAIWTYQDSKGKAPGDPEPPQE